jgi:putative DNA primase/helicase
MDRQGRIHSLERIYPNGRKLALKGGRKGGLFFTLGEVHPGCQAVLCEGVATGCSVHEATGLPVIICFSASNLKPVADQFRDLDLVVAADLGPNLGLLS